MLNISKIVAKAEAMFDLFNDHFYAGEMARPAITVSPDGGRGAYGWCSVYEIWQANGAAYREINICAEYINRPIGEVAATMLHEMAHLYNLNHGIMKCGKLTAKLRDAVPVRFYENGREVKRYKNIEIPDAVKELEFQDFKFDVPLNGAITFKIFFGQGILPEVWPEARQRRTRASKAADPEPMTEDTTPDATETPQDAADPVDGESVEEAPEVAGNAGDAATTVSLIEDDSPGQKTMEIRFDVAGSARKALAAAIGEHTGAYPSYQAAPSFAYLIGDYSLDRNGTLAGPKNDYLIYALTEDGYQTR